MAKASAPGRTKTRLVPHLTPGDAADFNTACLRDIGETLLRAGGTAAIQGYMAFGPPGTEAFFEETLPPGIGLFGCWHASFGTCLMRAAEELFARGHGSACLLNADSPNLPSEVLVEAAESLARPGDRIVLGPSRDGGYYLIGMKRLHGRLFEDIAWSTEEVAAQTLARIRELDLPVHVLPTWYDVDDAPSLSWLSRDLVSAPGWVARHSRDLLSHIGGRSDPHDRPVSAAAVGSATGSLSASVR